MVTERTPGRPVASEGGPYRAASPAPRLPWIAVRWRARSEAVESAGFVAGVIVAVVGFMVSIAYPVPGMILLAAGAGIIALGKRTATMRLAVTDRFVSGGHGGFLGAGFRLPLQDVERVVLLEPGAPLNERLVTTTWWLALRDRKGRRHRIAAIDDPREARWLASQVEAWIAERLDSARAVP